MALTQRDTQEPLVLDCRETMCPALLGGSLEQGDARRVVDRTCRLDELSPRESWIEMALNAGSVLVDVRSAPEWSISGRPNLEELDARSVFVEWEVWPRNKQNLGFFTDLMTVLAGQIPSRLFFLCRSGPRALSAAMEFSNQLSERGAKVHCTNIANGFDGDLDSNGHRANANGWKYDGLPWLQD